MDRSLRPRDAYAAALAAYESGSLGYVRERLEALLRQEPDHVPALILAGIVAARLLQLDAALGAFDRALALAPDEPAARFNKAGVLLLQGDWVNGLRLYEARRRNAPGASRPGGDTRTPGKDWLGAEPLDGKTLLLRCEQGLGDTLQFCRYAPVLAARGARVMLEVQRPLVTLLCDLPGITRILAQGAALPPCDYQAPLLSMPLACGTTPESVPYPTPYLSADASKIKTWRDRLGSAHTLRIGLAWRGNVQLSHDRSRSVPLELLLRHLPPGPHYVSLQKELSAGDARLLAAHGLVADHREHLDDFSDTAALCACLDLVISIDTSVAHLSAGLGIPTWILLPYSPGWRWLLHREDTPWYASAVLFRQPRPDAWEEVCARIADRLDGRVAR